MTLRIAKPQVETAIHTPECDPDCGCDESCTTPLPPDEPVLVNPFTEEEILMLQLRRAKADKTQAEQTILELEKELIKRAEARGLKTLVAGGFQATVVRRETTKIDESALQDRLGPKWDHVTTTRFDRAKLESAISLGIVSIDDVAAVSQLVAAKPYVRVSEVVEEADT